MYTSMINVFPLIALSQILFYQMGNCSSLVNILIYGVRSISTISPVQAFLVGSLLISRRWRAEADFFDRNKSNTSHTKGRSESGQDDDFEPAEFCTMDSKSTDNSTGEAVWETCHMTSSGMAAGCDDVSIDDIISDLMFPIPMEELRPYLDSFEDASFDDVLA